MPSKRHACQARFSSDNALVTCVEELSNSGMPRVVCLECSTTRVVEHFSPDTALVTCVAELSNSGMPRVLNYSRLSNSGMPRVLNYSSSLE